MNLDQIVRDVREGKRHGQNDLAIWGGECAETGLLAFLAAWDLSEMPFRIWEYASRIDFQRGTLPDNISLLERGRLFGEGGDLTLRRGGPGFFWHFVGQSETYPPANYKAEDFWNSNTDLTFHRWDETALLWGERKNGATRWLDDRVGRADLDYPVPEEWKRVQVRYWAFSHAGRTAFVWLRGLEEWKEAQNG
jgi:hypothetical protein